MYLGGGSVVNGGLLWRTPPWVLEQWEREHGLKGYTSENLLRHFTEIENRLHVVPHTMGNAGNLDSIVLAQGADRLNWKYAMARRALINCKNTNQCPTGCPSGAKQSMLETYLPEALNNGASLFSGLRALQIESTGRKAKRVIAKTLDQRTMIIDFDHLELAAGAIQTPHLLRRSRLSKTAGGKLEFHINLNILARFNQAIDAYNGTMFTVQVQEFEKDGLLFMASNISPNYMELTLAHLETNIINEALENHSYYVIYAAMIRPNSKARIVSWLGDQPLVFYKFEPSDIELIKDALTKASKLLFASGAKEIILPKIGTGTFKTFEGVQRALETISPKCLELQTLHVMSSCPMGQGREDAIVDLQDRLNEFDNIFICDASVLPTNIGESPQGTIMAFAYEIILRHLNG
jgi:choline dehydrogenase-like flavoprotein